MKNVLGWLSAIGLVLAAAALLPAGPASAQNIALKSNMQKIPPPGPQPCPGPDLYITQTNIQVQNINGQWWVVTRAVVANKGNKDYDGKLGQALAQLTLKKSWDPGHPEVMTTADITHLAKGAGRNAGGSFRLADYLRAGCAPPLKPTECCREVQILLKIVFDPDIRADNNPNNDDCNPNNDSLPDTPDTHIKFTASCLKLR